MRTIQDIIYSVTARINHALTAGNAHNIHSPYVFELYNTVINESVSFKKQYTRLDKKNNIIKKEVNGLLIKELENIIVSYVCV